MYSPSSIWPSLKTLSHEIFEVGHFHQTSYVPMYKRFLRTILNLVEFPLSYLKSKLAPDARVTTESWLQGSTCTGELCLFKIGQIPSVIETPGIWYSPVSQSLWSCDSPCIASTMESWLPNVASTREFFCAVFSNFKPLIQP